MVGSLLRASSEWWKTASNSVTLFTSTFITTCSCSHLSLLLILLLVFLHHSSNCVCGLSRLDNTANTLSRRSFVLCVCEREERDLVFSDFLGGGTSEKQISCSLLWIRVRDMLSFCRCASFHTLLSLSCSLLLIR